MRFNLGRIPESKDFVPDETWKPLREPDPWAMQLLAIPLGIVAFIAVGALWFYAIDLKKSLFELPASLAVVLFSFVVLIVVHELVHALVHLHSGRSNQSILGFWPSRLLFYVHYDGELTRKRFITILAMPTIVITFMPLMVAMASKITSGFALCGARHGTFCLHVAICSELPCYFFKFRAVPFVATKVGERIGRFWVFSDFCNCEIE